MGKRSREKRERRSEKVTTEKKLNSLLRLEKTSLFIIRWGAYLALFTPLIIHLKFFFPFVAPKTIFFQIIVEIIFTAYLFLVIFRPNYRPKINFLTLAVILFLGVFILASLTGVNFQRSFWSTYERMTGIWAMIHLFAFFIILSSVFKKREDWEKLLALSVGVGVLLSFYILLGDEVSTRGGGTIGNTSFMAAYLLFDIFFALILFLVKRGGWQIFSGISLIIMLWVFLTSTAQGAIISFFGGLFLFILGYLIFSQKKLLKRLAFGLILFLIILGVISAVVQPYFLKDKAKSTLAEMKPRLVVWEKGLKGFKERPILGWGPENFNNVFLKYFNPCMFLSECGGEIWFDRVHNIIFDTLVTTGIIGFLSYLLIFILALYGLLNILPRIGERKNVFLPLGMAVLLIVYFFQNLLVFDMINSYLVFFLSLAFINFLIQKSSQEMAEKEKREGWSEIESSGETESQLVAGGGRRADLGKPFEGGGWQFPFLKPLTASLIIIIIIFSLWFGNFQPLIANYYIIKTISSEDVEKSSQYFQKSLATWMNKYEAREHFGQKMSKTPSEVPAGSRETFSRAFELAEKELEKSCQENPLDFRPHFFLGELYIASYRFSQEPEKLWRGEEVLKKAIELSPTNQQGYWDLAEVKVIQGKVQESILLLEKAVALNPKVALSHWYLAMAYKIAGQYQLAKEEVIKAQELGYHWEENFQNLKRVIEIYLAFNDDAGLVPLYLKALELNPHDPQLWASLAASYANLGQFEKARKAAEKVIEINPEFTPRVKEFLKSLP